MNYRIYSDCVLSREGAFSRDVTEQENHLVKLYPHFTDQTWEAFGGAVTDSAAYVFSQMSEDLQNQLLDAYFGSNGLKYRLIRVPIDSCDFSLEQYEAAPDGDPAHFDLSRPLRYVLPMLEAIRAREPEIRLMLSPWSPPKVFKTNHQRHGGGKCKPEHYKDWAAYICRYIRELTERGFTVSCISLQNEPHAVQTWDSCIWSEEEEREFLVRYMKPALKDHGFPDLDVYIWDHNKERILDRAIGVFDQEGRAAANGIAFHWYSGDHFDALRKVHEIFPEKKLLLSENCFEYRFYGAEEMSKSSFTVAHEIIGDLESGTSCFLDWNMLLNEQGGPNYVGNYCCAPFLYHTDEKCLCRQDIYQALWHFAHFIPSGSRRILSSSFSRSLEKTAFRRPDGSLVLVLLNAADEEITAYVSVFDQLAEITVPGASPLTIEIFNG